jgi:hypothetical protein
MSSWQDTLVMPFGSPSGNKPRVSTWPPRCLRAVAVRVDAATLEPPSAKLPRTSMRPEFTARIGESADTCLSARVSTLARFSGLNS